MAGVRRAPPGFGAKAGAPPGEFVWGMNFRSTVGAVTDPPEDVHVPADTITPTPLANALGHTLSVQFSTDALSPETTARSVDPRLKGSYWWSNNFQQAPTSWHRILLTGAALTAGSWECEAAGGSVGFGGYNAGFRLYDTNANLDSNTDPLIISQYPSVLSTTDVLDVNSVLLNETTWPGSHVKQPFVKTVPGELAIAMITVLGGPYVVPRHFRFTKL